MVQNADDLIGFTLHAIDGDIGRVHDIYFDDRDWTVRYLVVDTRHWLPGRRILLSPVSIRQTHWARREIVVSLSREQIRRSPSVDSDQPIGRRTFALFRECYTKPYYWALGGFFWGPGSTGPRRHPGSSRLRSTRLLSDYRVTAVDGDIGHVDGFLIDDRSWALCCLIVRTRHWPAGRRVLVPTEWVAWTSWIELTVHVDLPVERILHGPDYDPSQPITAPDQTRVMAYYGRAPRDRRDTRPA